MTQWREYSNLALARAQAPLDVYFTHLGSKPNIMAKLTAQAPRRATPSSHICSAIVSDVIKE